MVPPFGPVERAQLAAGAPGWVLERGFLAWRVRPDCFGSCLFGVVDAEVMSQMCELLGASTRAHAPRPMDIIADGRAQGTLLPEAVEVATAFIGRELELARACTRRLVILSPANVTSATLIGAVAFGGLSVPLLRADDLPQAGRVLDRPELVAPLRLLEVAITEASGVPPWLSSLRHLLRTDLDRAEPAELARRLGLSVRTLQRKLAELGLSLHQELTAARVAIAAELLAETDDKLDAIALRAGFSSRAHLARAFLRERGESPDQFRRTKRG